MATIIAKDLEKRGVFRLKGSLVCGLVAGSVLGAVTAAVAMPYVKPKMKKAIRKSRRMLHCAMDRKWF